VAAWVAGVAITLWVAHSQRNSLYDYDGRFWYVGGVMWLRGESPYAHGPFVATWIEQFGRPPADPCGFVYPGTILPISLAMGLLPWDVARWGLRGASLCAWIATWWLVRRRFVAEPSAGGTPWRRDFWAGLSLVAPGAGLTLFQGQLALLVTLGLVLTWLGLEGRRAAWVAVGAPLALVKPQLAAVPVIFLLTRYADRRAWTGLGAAVALAGSVLLWSPPARLVEDLVDSYRYHRQQFFNHPECYEHVAALFGRTPAAPMLFWTSSIVACAAAAVLGVRARRAEPPGADLRLFQIALVLTAVAMPVHRYDLAIHALVLATAWALGPAWRGVLIALLVLAHGATWWFASHVMAARETGLWKEAWDAASDVAAYVSVTQLALLAAYWWTDRRVLVRAPHP
jgi:hypothetical protein